LMHQGLTKRLARGCIPQPSGPVLTPGDDRAAVGTESDAANRSLMRPELRQAPVLRNIPEARVAVFASREEDVGTLWMEGHGTDRAWMPKHASEQGLRGHVPKPGFSVPTSGEDGLPIGVKGHGHDRPRMVEGLPPRFSRRYLPEPGGPVI